ncbi:MAG: hypothetical protein LBD67_03530 [Candidatus Accumulibacter sp.]|jgi:hypothetical protein|nr:hypothetical protein [Accumulibacter sp.]
MALARQHLIKLKWLKDVVLIGILRQAQDERGARANLPNHRQRLSPFVLSLSKQERTLQVVNTLSNPDSFFESFFNPYLSIAPISVRAEPVEV